MPFQPHTSLRPLAQCLSLGALVLGHLSLSLLPSQATLLGNGAQFGAKLTFPPTQDLGAPARTTGGGTRGTECVAKEEKLPLHVIAPPATYNKTSDTTPELVVYVGDTSAEVLEVRILDSSLNIVGPLEPHRIPLQGRKTGLVTISLLPEDAAALDPGKYNWSVMLVCNVDNSDRGGNPYSFGDLEVVSLETQELEALDQLQGVAKAERSLNNLLGYDTLAIAASLHSSDPETWTELVTSLKLGEETQAVITQANFLD